MSIEPKESKASSYILKVAGVIAALAVLLGAFTDFFDNFKGAIESYRGIKVSKPVKEPASPIKPTLVINPKVEVKPDRLDKYVTATMRYDKDFFFIDLIAPKDVDLDVQSLTGISSFQNTKGWFGSTYPTVCRQTTPPRDSISYTLKCNNLYEKEKVETNLRDYFFYYTLLKVIDLDNSTAKCSLYTLDMRTEELKNTVARDFIHTLTAINLTPYYIEVRGEGLREYNASSNFIDGNQYSKRTDSFKESWKAEDVCSIWLDQFKPQ